MGTTDPRRALVAPVLEERDRPAPSLIDELAIFGGKPSFESPVHVGLPNIGRRDRLMERMEDLLDRRWLSNDGPYLIELERRVADYLGVRHCVCVSSGTAALELAYDATELSGEVIVPSFTFVATAHALRSRQLEPVFCDVDPDTYTIDPRRIEELVTPRTSAIVGVHLWGRACDTDAIASIAKRHGLKVVYDAAHAFGCSHGSRMIGGFGDAEVFSFHATKVMNTFEGGALVTNDDDLATRVRRARNFGLRADDEVIEVGTNAKLSEPAAAMGITSLESLHDFIAVNYRNYLAYRDHLADVPGVRLLEYDEGELYSFHNLVVEVVEEKAGIDRDTLQRILVAEGVRARRYFHPGCHRMEPYRDLPSAAPQRLPVTERLVATMLSLPTGDAVDEIGIARICALIALVSSSAGAVRRRLAEPLGDDALSIA